MMGEAAIIQRYGARVGETFGDLKLVAISGRRGDNRRIYGEFVCRCGNRAEMPIGRIVNSKARSHCGCKTDMRTNLKHGMRGTPEYRSWSAMKGRCLDPNNKDYPRWGGRGITIHPAWISSFDAFYAHVGPRPDGTSLDRIDNRKGYEPGNVRWADSAAQARNRSDNWAVEIDGVTYETQSAAAEANGVSETTITRWCEGYFDRRREHHANGGRKPPRPGCRRWRKQ